MDRYGEEKLYCPHLGSNPGVSQPIAKTHNLVIHFFAQIPLVRALNMSETNPKFCAQQKL